MSIKPPEEVVRRVRFWRRKIEECYKKGYKIELQTDDVVELLAFNLALNLCIERRIFDKEIRGTGPRPRLASLILKKLGDMLIHQRDRFVSRMIEEGYTERLVNSELDLLITNGLVYQKKIKDDSLIGRGPCLVLKEIAERTEVLRLQCPRGIHEFPSVHGAIFSIDTSGKLIRNPPYRDPWSKRQVEWLNGFVDRGIDMEIFS